MRKFKKPLSLLVCMAVLAMSLPVIVPGSAAATTTQLSKNLFDSADNWQTSYVQTTARDNAIAYNEVQFVTEGEETVMLPPDSTNYNMYNYTWKNGTIKTVAALPTDAAWLGDGDVLNSFSVKFYPGGQDASGNLVSDNNNSAIIVYYNAGVVAAEMGYEASNASYAEDYMSIVFSKTTSGYLTFKMLSNSGGFQTTGSGGNFLTSTTSTVTADQWFTAVITYEYDKYNNAASTVPSLQIKVELFDESGAQVVDGSYSFRRHTSYPDMGEINTDSFKIGFSNMETGYSGTKFKDLTVNYTHTTTPAEEAAAFKTAHAAVLALTVDTVISEDVDAVNAAKSAFTVLSADAQALLDAEGINDGFFTALIEAAGSHVEQVKFAGDNFDDPAYSAAVWETVPMVAGSTATADFTVANGVFKAATSKTIYGMLTTVKDSAMPSGRILSSSVKITPTVSSSMDNNPSVIVYFDGTNYFGFQVHKTSAGLTQVRPLKSSGMTSSSNAYLVNNTVDNFAFTDNITLSFAYDYSTEGKIAVTVTVVNDNSDTKSFTYTINVTGGTYADNFKFGLTSAAAGDISFDDYTASFEQSAEEEAEAFRQAHARVLALTTATAVSEDASDITAALNAYDLLSSAVKELLTSEKALLDALDAYVAGLASDAKTETLQNEGYFFDDFEAGSDYWAALANAGDGWGVLNNPYPGGINSSAKVLRPMSADNDITSLTSNYNFSLYSMKSNLWEAAAGKTLSSVSGKLHVGTTGWQAAAMLCYWYQDEANFKAVNIIRQHQGDVVGTEINYVVRQIVVTDGETDYKTGSGQRIATLQLDGSAAEWVTFRLIYSADGSTCVLRLTDEAGVSDEITIGQNLASGELTERQVVLNSGKFAIGCNVTSGSLNYFDDIRIAFDGSVYGEADQFAETHHDAIGLVPSKTTASDAAAIDAALADYAALSAEAKTLLGAENNALEAAKTAASQWTSDTAASFRTIFADAFTADPNAETVIAAWNMFNRLNAADKADLSTEKAAMVDFLLSYEGSVSAIETPIKIAAMGDSLTYGSGSTAPATDSWPVQFANAMNADGTVVDVRNYGVAGYRLVADYALGTAGGLQYENDKTRNFYGNSKFWEPDVVIIMLGTNDVGVFNVSIDERIEVYKEMLSYMIGEYRKLDSAPTVIIATSPTRNGSSGNTSLEDLMARSERLVEAQKEVAAAEGCPVIDIFSLTDAWTTEQRAERFATDNLHFTTVGYTEIASYFTDFFGGMTVNFQNSALGLTSLTFAEPAAPTFGEIYAEILAKADDTAAVVPADVTAVETMLKDYAALSADEQTAYQTAVEAVAAAMDTYRPFMNSASILTKTDNQDLRFKTLAPSAAVPEGYAIVSYGTVFYPNQLLGTAELTLETSGASVASAVLADGASMDEFYYARLVGSSGQTLNCSVRIAARSFVVYKDGSGNEFTLYSTNDYNNDASDVTKGVNSGVAVRSVYGIARNMAKAVYANASSYEVVYSDTSYDEEGNVPGIAGYEELGTAIDTPSTTSASLLHFVVVNKDIVNSIATGNQ